MGKYLLAATLAFIALVVFNYQEEVKMCLLDTPACHRTNLFHQPAEDN